MKQQRAVLMVLAVLASASIAFAEEIRIDHDSNGTVYDSILDGFPGLAAFDGQPDFGNNALGIALKNGATEERAVIEFALADLHGLASEQVTATLHFNIDDVVSTFGPGTGFDGTAASFIDVFAYAGNGSIELGDFSHAAGTPEATADTSAHGIITDASLDASGPLAFRLDVTGAIRDRLDAQDDFAGFVFSTGDDQSATSLDDLGEAAQGPPGAGGSFLPYLVVVVEEATTTTTSTTTTLEAAECGDANGDGKVSAIDALVILHAAVGMGSCAPAVCDVDGNGKVNAGDALRTLKSAVGHATPMLCDLTTAAGDAGHVTIVACDFTSATGAVGHATPMLCDLTTAAGDAGHVTTVACDFTSATGGIDAARSRPAKEETC
ncbi:MAG TPA: dockerin type I domain-containing protein [Candidatus Binatia bacterium]|nr:dockerin type I domain-containing protein [Candidatus Binatia bacterium]